MGTPYPRTPWVTPSRRVSTPPLWTSRNPNLLVGANLDIGNAVNKELHIKVIFKNKIGSNLSNLVRSCPNLSRLVKTCLNLLVGANLDIRSAVSKVLHSKVIFKVQICSNLSKLVQT